MRYQSWWTSKLDYHSHVFDGEACLGAAMYIALCDHAVEPDEVDKTGDGSLCWSCFHRLRAGVPQQRLAAQVLAGERRRIALLVSPRNKKHRSLA